MGRDTQFRDMPGFGRRYVAVLFGLDEIMKPKGGPLESYEHLQGG